jgi:hypothetical protein
MVSVKSWRYMSTLFVLIFCDLITFQISFKTKFEAIFIDTVSIHTIIIDTICIRIYINLFILSYFFF